MLTIGFYCREHEDRLRTSVADNINCAFFPGRFHLHLRTDGRRRRYAKIDVIVKTRVDEDLRGTLPDDIVEAPLQST